MKLVINVPDYVKEQADDGKGEQLGIPLWLAYEIANGTPLKEVLGDIQIELQRLADDKWNQEVGSSKGLEDAIDVIEDQKERDS